MQGQNHPTCLSSGGKPGRGGTQLLIRLVNRLIKKSPVYKVSSKVGFSASSYSQAPEGKPAFFHSHSEINTRADSLKLPSFKSPYLGVADNSGKFTLGPWQASKMLLFGSPVTRHPCLY